MNEKKLEKMYDVLKAMYEIINNRFVIVVNNEIFKSYKKNETVNNFKKRADTNKRQLKRNMLGVAKRSLKLLNKATVKTLATVDLNLDTKNQKKKNENSLGLLVSASLENYTQKVNRIWRLSNQENLFSNLLSTINNVSDQPKVETSSGRKWGYKEYMEMSVRTSIANEVIEQQLELGKKTNNVFFTTNVWSDSADVIPKGANMSHKDMQGKIYFDNRYKSFGFSEESLKEIEHIIKTKCLMSVQEARQSPYYFATRPNCRHSFYAISLDQAKGNVKEVIAKNNLIMKKDTNYTVSQEQRYIERNIRSFKFKEQQATLFYKEDSLEDVRKLIDYNARYRAKWEAKMKKLINENPTLKKDTRRQTRDVVLNDLGISYGKRTF